MPNKLGKTDICNLALRHIGVRPVNNVETDPDVAATEMNAIWDNAVQNVLRASEWNFAKKITPLALLADEEVIGWRFLYAYPRDCAVFWKVDNPVTIRNNEVDPKFELILSPVSNTPAIATDLEGAYGRYTAIVTDTTRWDSSFVDCLAWRLALDACPRLSTDSQDYQNCSRGFSMAISNAMTMNQREDNNNREKFGFFINVR